MLAVDQDHARAGAEDRALEATNRLLEAVDPAEAGDRRRLAARDDEPVEADQLLGLAHLHGIGAEPLEHASVLAEVSLECENADTQALAHGTNCSSILTT